MAGHAVVAFVDHLGALLFERRQPLVETILAGRTLRSATTLFALVACASSSGSGAAATTAATSTGLSGRRRFLLEVGQSLPVVRQATSRLPCCVCASPPRPAPGSGCGCVSSWTPSSTAVP